MTRDFPARLAPSVKRVTILNWFGAAFYRRYDFDKLLGKTV
jgi:hypothetical protein